MDPNLDSEAQFALLRDRLLLSGSGSTAREAVEMHVRNVLRNLRHEHKVFDEATAAGMWSENTRKNRRMLVAVCATGLSVAYLGVFPTEIQALGIKFEPEQQPRVVLGIAIAVSYFLIMFSSIAFAERQAWLRSLRTSFNEIRGLVGALKIASESPVRDQIESLADFDESKELAMPSMGRGRASDYVEFAMPILIAATTIVCLLCAFVSGVSNAQPETPNVVGSFSTAKKRAFDVIYQDRRTTVYCDCSFDANKAIDASSCGYVPRNPTTAAGNPNQRAQRMEWEHVVPASRFGRMRTCWQDKNSIPECSGLDSRKCCRKVDQEFKEMEADLMNLRPAVGELNADRSDNPYGLIEGEPRQYGACDFEVQGGVAEPDESDRGEIGRTYLYMEHAWGMTLTAEERALFTAWHQADPPDDFEISRNQRIEALQGMGSPFVTNPDDADGGMCRGRSECCRVCVTSQACGDSCVSASSNCSKGRGCACQSSEVCE